ncbi:MAG TPA: hypothetical protein V6D20_06745 [Candidatus Obscuribacterales bacterium]
MGVPAVSVPPSGGSACSGGEPVMACGGRACGGRACGVVGVPVGVHACGGRACLPVVGVAGMTTGHTLDLE